MSKEKILAAQVPATLNQVQNFLALWLWLSVKVNEDFSLTSGPDNTSAIKNWPTGDSLAKLTKGFAGMYASASPAQIETLLATISNLLQTRTTPVSVTIADQVVTVDLNYGMAISAAKNVLLAIRPEPLYDPGDPTCSDDTILAMVPKP